MRSKLSLEINESNLFINHPLTAIFMLSQAQQNNKLKSTISYLGNMNGTDS